MFLVMILTWFIFENYGGMKLKSVETGTIPAIYFLFVIFTAIMVILIIRDWIYDIKDVMRQEQIMMDTGHNMMTPITGLTFSAVDHQLQFNFIILGLTYFKLLLSNWIEVVYLGGLGLVLALGVSSLWPLLTILLVLLAGREMFQMSVSLRRYLLTFENWVEMTMVALVRYG